MSDAGPSYDPKDPSNRPAQDREYEPGDRFSDPKDPAAGGPPDFSIDPVEPSYAAGGPVKTSGKAIFSLVLGIMSIVLCLGFLAGLPAILFGILGMRSVSRSGGRIGGQGLAVAGIALGSVGSVVGTMMMCFIFGPVLMFTMAGRQVAQQVQAQSRLKEIGTALLLYETEYGTLPAAGDDGQGAGPKLSWRVHLLPYLGEQGLYDEFHLDEPWDSPHNRALIDRMPDVYKNPLADTEGGKTVFLAVTGPEATFTGGTEGPPMASITDGPGETILVVEVDEGLALEWTRPGDWQFDPDNPRLGLGGNGPAGGFHALFADGHVENVQELDVDDDALRAMLTARAGDTVERDGGIDVEFGREWGDEPAQEDGGFD